jgi:glutathione S-transferase
MEEPLRKWTEWMQEWSRATGERPRIPVLRYIDESGKEHVLPESNEINLFIDAQGGGARYTPTIGSDAYNEMMGWWQWCDTEMKPLIDLYKYGKNLKWDATSNEIYAEQLRAYVGKIETHLTHHAYLVEERLTLADIAIIPFIRQIMRTRNGEFDFSDFPRVHAWANTILETDWFQNEVMKKYPLADIGPAYEGEMKR